MHLGVSKFLVDGKGMAQFELINTCASIDIPLVFDSLPL